MKKSSALLALLLCLCIGVCVAEPLNTRPLYTCEAEGRIDFLYYVDLLTVYSDSAYTLMAPDGTMLSAPYARLIAVSAGSGYVIEATASETAVTLEPGSDAVEAVQVNASGLLDLNGHVILPVEYAYADPLNEHWGIGYTAARVGDDDKYDLSFIIRGMDSAVHAAITRADIYDLDSGAMVASLTPDQYKRIQADGAYLTIADSDGKAAAYDGSFTDVTEAYIASRNAGNSTGAGSKLMMPDSFYDSDARLYGLKADDGTVLCPAEYSDVTVYGSYDIFPMHVFRLKTPDGAQLYGIVSADGQIIREPDGSVSDLRLSPMDDRYATLYCELNGERFYGVIDREGKMVVPVEYKNVQMSAGDDFAVCKTTDDMILIYSLTDGKPVADAVPEKDIRYAKEERSVLVTYNDSGKAVIFCGDGTVTEFPDGTSASSVSGSKGVLFLSRDADYNFSLVDDHGNVILTDHSDFSVSASGSYMLAKNNTTGKYELFALDLD